MQQRPSRWLFHLAAVVAASLFPTGVMGQGALRFEDVAPRIIELASPGPDRTKAQGELANQISFLGPAAARRVTPLLRHENPAVRDLATKILCNMHGLREESLDALIEAKLHGNEEIAIAIAGVVGATRAGEFLVEELRKDKRAGTRTYWALYILGKNAVPPLVKLIESGPLDDELAATVVSVFGELRDEAKSAVEPLTEFITARMNEGRIDDSPAPDANEFGTQAEPATGRLTLSLSDHRVRKTVECVILALGAIGEKARGSSPVLLKLAERDPHYTDAVDRSLQAMNKPKTIADDLRHLGECPTRRLARVDLYKWRTGQDESLIDPLIEFISLRQGNENSIAYAVWMLGSMGPKARRAAPVLLKLAEENRDAYQYVVEEALLEMGATDSAPAVSKIIEEHPDRSTIRNIAKLGERGRPTGPALVHCLERDDWEVRLDAARAIGDIGYTEGAPHLIKLLDEKDDWRLVFVAAKSLGRLRAAEAVEPLTELSRDHWYPPVREVANETIRVIQGKATYPESSPDRLSFSFEYDEYKYVKPERAFSGVGLGKPDSGESPVAEPNSLDPAQLARLTYKDELWFSNVDGQGHSVERCETIDRVPQVGIRVNDGYLVGFDQGEFGGRLLFIDMAGKRTDLWGNTQGIHQMPFGIIAVTGYAHLTNEGMLVKVFRGEDGTWRASRWKSLPGFPGESVLLANGNLWIGCGSNGCVELTPSGELQMAGSGK